MAKALFDWPIVLQYDVKAKYRLISRKCLGMTFFLPERSLNQPKATRVCIRSINQSNRSISVRLFFSVLFTRFHFKKNSIKQEGNRELHLQFFQKQKHAPFKIP